jgi:pimeloyl-ACP methyl ester carboxylesterase
MKVETGVLHDQFPYVRVGSGRQPLVVLPGLNLDNRTANGLVARSYGQGFRRLTAEHTLYIVQRPRGVSALADMRKIAAEYADLLSQELGQVRLMGLSTGGLIAQHIALDHPELVQRLVLVVSAARLSARGRDICRRWLDLAQHEQWRRLRGEMAAAAVDGAGTQRLARAFGSLFGGKAPTPTAAADFVATVNFDLAHDTTDELSGLEMPAIVIGGADDPFFPEPLLRETAAAIPRAELRVYPHSGHGLPKRHGKQLQEHVLKFLAAP